ncbi:MAG: hypothetical protein AB2A00_13680 [Myxococcota bacterium]
MSWMDAPRTVRMHCQEVVMAAAALVGLGSGALHSVTGPDHVLSLTPLSLTAGSRSWRLGLRWGIGHSLGTIVVAVAASMLVQVFHLGELITWGERLGGLALVFTGVMGLLSLRRGVVAREHCEGTALSMGLVHGIAGGAAVLVMLPAVAPSTWHAAAYLSGFSLGSTVAMAALTRVLGRGGALVNLNRAWLGRIVVGASVASVLLGTVWLTA